MVQPLKDFRKRAGVFRPGVVALILFSVPGCGSDETDSLLGEAIDVWLGCTECLDGELDALLQFEESAIPGLRDALLEGLPDSAVVVYRESLDADYERLLNRAVQEGIHLGITRGQYIDSHTSNVVARQQIRAAVALHSIGGSEAREALETALTSGARDDVIEAVQALLASS